MTEALNPTEEDGVWYDTPEELVEGCAAEIERCQKRIDYLQAIIEEVVNRHG